MKWHEESVRLSRDNYPSVAKPLRLACWVVRLLLLPVAVLNAVACALLVPAILPTPENADRQCSNSDSQQIEIVELLQDVRTCLDRERHSR